MFNSFLEEYIHQRGGESTVLRTQYGLLDPKTGEQLMTFANIREAFGDNFVLVRSLPNKGYVELEIIPAKAPTVNANSIYSAEYGSATIALGGTFVLNDDNPAISSMINLNGKDTVAGINGTNWSVNMPTSDLSVGSYPFTVSVTAGVTGNTATGSKNSTISITKPPFVFTKNLSATATVETNASVTLSVTASGGVPPYSYLWTKDGTTVSSNSNSMTISNAQSTNAGVYVCKVTESLGSVLTSASCTLTVNPLPLDFATAWTTSYPFAAQSGTVSIVSPAATGGTAPYTYKWVQVVSGSDVQVGTAKDLTITYSYSNLGTYRLDVTDSKGVKKSSPIITVSYAAAALALSTALPAETAANEGEVLTLTVAATGGYNPLTYVWKNGSTVLTGKTTASISLTPDASFDGATISCTVTDASGANKSSSTSILYTPAG